MRPMMCAAPQHPRRDRWEVAGSAPSAAGGPAERADLGTYAGRAVGEAGAPLPRAGAVDLAVEVRPGGQQTAIHRDRLAGDEPGVVGGQEQARAGDVGALTDLRPRLAGH